ncbi:MAG TPA: (d)CMP kinase [Anaerolineales bacterium]|nr:(d)CMP kinase [Anaerolineales bacterium]
MSKPISIAIDGPAASGKSTLALALAERLGYLYFDTGAMYRAVTLVALNRGVDLTNEDALKKIAREINIELKPASQKDGRLSDVFIDGVDSTFAIRGKEVDNNVSSVSTFRQVRKALTEQQRAVGERGGVVMAGRDIGTVVLPNAELKIYLDATLEERARRRHAELIERGIQPSFEQILEGLRERDKIDSGRTVAPLRPADDAVTLKSNGLSREEVLELALKLARERQAVKGNSAQEAGYQNPLGVRLFRATFAPLFRLVFLILSRVRIEGKGNIPKSGPYIIAYNHISLFEPPLLLAFWPTFPEAVAGADVLDRPGQRILVRGYGVIPIHRGEYDRQVIQEMMRVLAAGRPLMIAPEGGRSHKPGLRRGFAGVAYIMDRARVPVLPVGISGTSDDFAKRALRGKRPELQIRIGKPFILPLIEGSGEQRRAGRQANADLVMRHIAAQLPEEYWGLYRPI